jgi:hypothetical protein
MNPLFRLVKGGERDTVCVCVFEIRFFETICNFLLISPIDSVHKAVAKMFELTGGATQCQWVLCFSYTPAWRDKNTAVKIMVKLTLERPRRP